MPDSEIGDRDVRARCQYIIRQPERYATHEGIQEPQKAHPGPTGDCPDSVPGIEEADIQIDFPLTAGADIADLRGPEEGCWKLPMVHSA